jgi:hypothetical protein
MNADIQGSATATMERLDRLEAKLDSLANVVSLVAKKLDVQYTAPSPHKSSAQQQQQPPRTNEQQRSKSRSFKESNIPRDMGTNSRGTTGPWLLILFIHEAWLLFQHANVLCNPYLQRLDRDYGISLRESTCENIVCVCVCVCVLECLRICPYVHVYVSVPLFLCYQCVCMYMYIGVRVCFCMHVA